MLAVEWKSAARADVLAIVDYISDDSPVEAQLLKNEIETKVSELRWHPKMYRVGRVAGTREIVIRKNYIIIYSETSNQITILRVLHAAQSYP